MSCRAVLAALSLAALAGCDDCPPDYHVVRGMRVLGAAFDPPVAAPGGAVTVRALTADVEERAVAVDWYRCPAPLVLTPVAGVDAGVADAGPRGGSSTADVDLAAVVAPCLAQGAFARGTSVRVPIDADGGARDAFPWRTARRFTDLVGFACAGGAIEPPPKGGLWPRCTGARGVVFTASIPGPRLDGSATPPPRVDVTEVTLDGRAWGENDAPAVPRCEGSRRTCEPVPVSFRVPDVGVLTEPTALAFSVLGPPSDVIAFAGYHVTAAAPASTEECLSADEGALLRTTVDRANLAWVPPSEPGPVTFWFTARRLAGGVAVVRRTVVVQ